jgi:hypothetical protein
LLDFEELVEDDDLKEIDQPIRDRANLMMFPTSWREARVSRDNLFVAHALELGMRPSELPELDMSKEEDFYQINEAIMSRVFSDNQASEFFDLNKILADAI